ncbi:MAG TPA: alpha/beta hydrolase [Streptosporangiaceae bacterium]|jgi:pimeloyl-ACP methyl ester carboxylesterase
MRKLVVVAAAATMLAGGLGAALPSAAAATAHAQASGITWGSCSDTFLQQAGAQCAMLPVPLNYAHKNGPKIKVAVSIIRHTSSKADYKGIILTNPGGPGGSGLNLNVFLIEVLQQEASQSSKTAAAADLAAVADYDWVGFDPRGVGSSVPALTCQPDYFAGPRRKYDPTSASLLTYWLHRTQSYAQSCQAHSAAQAALLDNMTTKDAASDMNSIRQALHQSKMSYYGFSYGTYLGQVFASMFPGRVNRLIMDSNVDPRNIWYKANLNQDVAFQRNIGIWFRWLAKFHGVYHLGSTEAAVRHRFNAEEAKLATHPIDGVLGPDEWVDVFLEAGYFEQTWEDLGQTLSDWASTHSAAAGDTLVNDYEGTDTIGDDNNFAVYNAVQCTDIQWPLSWAKWSRDNHRVAKVAPFETWGNAWFNAPCLYWPAPASTPERISGSKISSALLIDETLDAATPFEGSVEVRKLFPHSVLLAEPGGTTHADSLFGDLCVDNTIARYLATGKLPKRSSNPSARWDKTCKPLPVPNPASSSSSSVPNSARAGAASPGAAAGGYAGVLAHLRGLRP